MKLAPPEIANITIEDDGSINYGDQKDSPMLLVLGDDGYYLRLKTPILESIWKLEVSKFNFPKVKEGAKFFLPKLPEKQLNEAHGFLRASFLKNKAETVILYYLNPANNTYEPFVPEQDVSGAHIKYDISVEESKSFRERGLILVGTIHSHPDFNAFQSGIDEHDEFSIDGWHITIGNVTHRSPNYDARWCVGNKTIHATIEDIVEFNSGYKEFPESWLDRVKKFVHKVVVTDSKDNSNFYWGKKNNGTIISGSKTDIATKDVNIMVFSGPKKARSYECTMKYLW